MMARDINIPLSAMIEKGIALLGDRINGTPQETQEQVLGFIQARLPGILQGIVKSKACLEYVTFSVAQLKRALITFDLWARTHALASLRDAAKDEFGVLAATFKRVGNIVRKAKEEGQYTEETSWDATALVEPAEKALWDSFSQMQSKAQNETNADLEKYYRAMLEEITLKPAVDKFFDDVLVMAEDDDLRRARLGMLSEVQGFFDARGRFSRAFTPRVSSLAMSRPMRVHCPVCLAHCRRPAQNLAGPRHDHLCAARAL